MDVVGWLAGGEYSVAREILQRGVGILFLIAFISAVNQFPALLGEHGLLPVPRFLASTYGRRQPTLFRWRYSDRLLLSVAWLGAGLSALVVAGIPQLAPSWVLIPVFLVIWLLYLSVVTVGQTFY
ncbi:MAG: hypothetical protein ACHP7F_12910, partial [Actinomycetales bacterium]